MDTGEVYRFDRFEDFVTSPPMAGLGADLAKIEAVCQDDPRRSGHAAQCAGGAAA